VKTIEKKSRKRRLNDDFRKRRRSCCRHDLREFARVIDTTVNAIASKDLIMTVHKLRLAMALDREIVSRG